MIPQHAITAWRLFAPWGSPEQVEQDLVLSRAICQLYSDSELAEHIVFRGGTALHKLFFEKPGRYSEDLDFVQIRQEPIGKTVELIRRCLDPWLGAPNWKQNHGRFTLYYRFQTETEPVVTRKIKIEINTREHFKVYPYITKKFAVENSWYTGKANVLTYSFEELLGTKLRALYQRKKGRDLYDFWYAMQQMPKINHDDVIHAFEHYMTFVNCAASRAEFEKNFFLKNQDPLFCQDIHPLLNAEQAVSYSVHEAYRIGISSFVEKMKGEPWKNDI